MAVLPTLWQEEQLLSTFFQNPFLIVSVFFISLVFLFIQVSRRSNGKLNLPPSPPRLLIIGNLHQLGSLLHQSLQQLSQNYGPDLLLLHLGQTPTIVVSSADMVREMIKSHDVVLSNRSQSTATDFLLYGSKDVSFSNYGEYWRQVRKVIVVELVSMKRVQQFQFVRDEEVTLLVNKIRKASLNGDSINLSDKFFGTSNNIVSRIVIGQSIAELEDFKSRFATPITSARDTGCLILTSKWISSRSPATKQLRRKLSGKLPHNGKDVQRSFDMSRQWRFNEVLSEPLRDLHIQLGQNEEEQCGRAGPIGQLNPLIKGHMVEVKVLFCLVNPSRRIVLIEPWEGQFQLLMLVEELLLFGASEDSSEANMLIS
ncbi:hypothetical protein FNV43_RR21456 [Rhamnella rubrinervis]|uniref:Cytochrome P450 n=1 Tax=Rhamnella rubrinervis TaxID=2594499 RepID=A0A8K0DW86_9ROSA|nr:hypothetical protein FNV43_RR21456 [Rhamnella rubrinervis]